MEIAKQNIFFSTDGEMFFVIMLFILNVSPFSFAPVWNYVLWPECNEIKQ